VKLLADPVTSVLAVHREALGLDKLLNERADRSESVARLAALFDGTHERLVRHFDQSLAGLIDILAHKERLRRVAVEPIDKHRDVDVYNVTVL
jgi:hypothetical protein